MSVFLLFELIAETPNSSASMLLEVA